MSPMMWKGESFIGSLAAISRNRSPCASVLMNGWGSKPFIGCRQGDVTSQSILIRLGVIHQLSLGTMPHKP